MDDTAAQNPDETATRPPGLDPLVGAFAFAVGSLLALYGGTAFAAHVFRHAVASHRIVFAEVFLPALAFFAGVVVAFGAAVGVFRRIYWN